MITINIKEDFSATTGFRTYDDGPKSGLEFFEKLLDNKFKEASEQSVKLKIILDGGEGYTSSFLNEAFRLLGEKYGADLVWNNLLIVSEERPKYIEKIKKSVYEMGK
jgi:phosphomannomutase